MFQQRKMGLERRQRSHGTRVSVHSRQHETIRRNHVSTRSTPQPRHLFRNRRRTQFLRGKECCIVGGTFASQCNVLLFELFPHDALVVLLDCHYQSFDARARGDLGRCVHVVYSSIVEWNSGIGMYVSIVYRYECVYPVSILSFSFSFIFL